MRPVAIKKGGARSAITNGHTDVTMTLNTYSHVLASLKEDAARRMDTALATNS
jgi:hypothetical protein